MFISHTVEVKKNPFFTYHAGNNTAATPGQYTSMQHYKGAPCRGGEWIPRITSKGPL